MKAIELQPLHLQALWNRGVLQYLYPQPDVAALGQAVKDIQEVYSATVASEGQDDHLYCGLIH